MKEETTQIQECLPYERFLRFGPEQMTEAELLAVIIRTGTAKHSALELAGQVLTLADFSKRGLAGLHELSVDDLKSIPGIGEVKAVKLKCLAELSVRMAAAAAPEGLRFSNSEQVASLYMERLRHRSTECVILACLDAKGRLIREKKMSEGSVRMSLISPREILMEALNAKAVTILLLHNHPSGDPTPSRQDVELTEHLKNVSELCDIPLLDHIIIGDKCYFSFQEHNWYLDS